MPDYLSISLVLASFLLYVGFISWLAVRLWKVSVAMLQMCRELGDLADPKALTSKVNSFAEILERQILELRELRGDHDALSQTTKSHISRYYRQEREQSREELMQELLEQSHAEEMQEPEPRQMTPHEIMQQLATR